MRKKPLTVVSSCAVVLFILASLSTVVGYQSGITNTRMCERGLRDDITPPMTTYSLDPSTPDGEDGWYIHRVIVTLNSTDNDSGVNVTYYQINNGSWMTYTSAVGLQECGYFAVLFYSVDNAGNSEVPKLVKIKIDFLPPVTTCDLPPPNGENGWYISSFIVTLNATDNWSGVNVTYYKANHNSWQIYTGPFIVYTDGPVGYKSIDEAGNHEDQNDQIIRMDSEPPQITMDYTWEGNPRHGYELIFTAVGNDAMSGMDRVEFYFNDELECTVTGPGPTYVWNYSYAPLPSVVIKAVAYDRAGLTADTEIINPHNYQNQHQLLQYLLLHYQKMNLLLNQGRNLK